MILSAKIEDILRCPACKSKIKRCDKEFVCSNSFCSKHFPIINDIPVLINEDNSIFSIEDFVLQTETTFSLKPVKGFKKTLLRLMPNTGGNLMAEENYTQLLDLLKNKTSNPKILIIGSGIIGKGLKVLLDTKSVELVESDVAFGPRTNLICDAHDIPFKSGSFDAVIVQAVLEHVVDPYRCVEEIHRVINVDGLVYADTPFMQQVHMGRYDFTRFTQLGHRRLFRKFEEINSGVSCGPGMALAWSYQYFLLSFVTSQTLRKSVVQFVNLTSFFLKYFDRHLIKKIAAADAASSFFFIGRKSDNILPDRELIKLYKGGM